MRPHAANLLILATALVLTSGCGAFERRWREAGRSGNPSDSISGRWTGTWQNTNNTHKSRLRAILAPEGTNVWTADFRARYGGWLTFTITTQLRGAPEGGGVRFHGEKDLGFLAGGVYAFDGFATPTNFSSTYVSGQNSGVFTMIRP